MNAVGFNAPSINCPRFRPSDCFGVATRQKNCPADNSAAFSFAIPDDWPAPVRRARALAWFAFSPAVRCPLTELIITLGIAVLTAARDLRAADPWIERVI